MRNSGEILFIMLIVPELILLLLHSLITSDKILNLSLPYIITCGYVSDGNIFFPDCAILQSVYPLGSYFSVMISYFFFLVGLFFGWLRRQRQYFLNK